MKRITKRMLAVLLALVMVIGFVPSNLSVVANAATNTIYVATTGDDSNDGSEAAPFATIKQALASITDDSVKTTILVADGAYNCSDSAQAMLIDKDNVTLTKANPDGEVIVYAYAATPSTSKHKAFPTIRVGADNVIIDGLTVMPAVTATSGQGFTAEMTVSAEKYPFLMTNDGVASGTTVYLPKDTSGWGTGGTIAVTDLCSDAARNLTIRNCEIGYPYDDDLVLTHTNISEYGGYGVAILLRANTAQTSGMVGEYHIENNTIYGRVIVKDTVTSYVSTIRNNHFYHTTIAFGQPEAGRFPTIRGNTFHSAYRNRDMGTYTLAYLIDYVRSTVLATTGVVHSQAEMSVIHLSNTVDIEGYPNQHRYYDGFIYTTGGANKVDTTMDSEEELGYYLGLAGEVTLKQDFTITKAGILPEKILATVNYGEYKITKTEGLELPAPSGYHWNDENVLEKDKWVASALLLENDLNMKFYVAADLVANGEYLAVTMNGKTVNLGDWKDGTGANEGKKYVTFSGIMATEMTKEISIQLYNANDEAVDGCAYTDSVRANADRLKEAYSTNENLMNLVTAVLNYGAAAQKYANANVADADLANYGWQ